MQSLNKLLFNRNTIGGIVGNILEWYDFAIYGFLAPIIGVQFFPQEDAFAQLISAYGIFAVGYFMRPFGGMIMGTVGDIWGRKRSLQISILLMAIPTFAMGCLPTYQQLGIFASILLICLRIFQGLSVGGEAVSSFAFMTELAPPNQRGLYGRANAHISLHLKKKDECMSKRTLVERML